MVKPRIKPYPWVGDGRQRWVCFTNPFDAYVSFTPADAYAGWSKVARHG